MNINAKDKNIEDVFGSTTYRIDFYQREYKWQLVHVEALLDDIFFKFESDYTEFSRGGITKVDANAIDDKFGWYYLNTFVTHTQKGNKYIVDGQQRFTTLTIILLKLYRLSKQYSSAKEDYVKKRIYDAGADGYSFWMGANEREVALEDIYKEGKQTVIVLVLP